MLVRSLKCVLVGYYWYHHESMVACKDKVKELFPNVLDGLFEVHSSPVRGSKRIEFGPCSYNYGENTEYMSHYVRRLGLKGHYYVRVS